ncbi:aminotransferase class III-fold pyridoxal phosphate-dependent enzyme [Saprospiraceae bacterium]|nr:aminotransferase class III-fold pyridoxal phosphate-dependent enzyme [Saprospiraceae bacterium]
MDTINNYHSIDAHLASLLIKHFYGITCECTPLVGYAEHNFLAKAVSGDKYLLKIPFKDFDPQEYEFQAELLLHLEKKEVHAPKMIESLQGDIIITWNHQNEERFSRLLTWIEGSILSDLDLRPPSICHSLGILTAQNTKALSDFDHDYARRSFEWNNDQPLWMRSHLHLFDEEDKSRLIEFLDLFSESQSEIHSLPKGIIHSDINENNVIFKVKSYKAVAVSLIDYGDAIYSSRINNLAITLAYAFHQTEDVLAAMKTTLLAYQEIMEVQDEELKHLYTLIGIRNVVSLVHAAISKVKYPESAYHQSSVEGNWRALKRLQKIGKVLFFEATLDALNRKSKRFDLFSDFASINKISLNDLFPNSGKNGVCTVNLGLESDLIPHKNDPYYEENFTINLARLQKENEAKFLVGGYGEVRDFYTTDSYKTKDLVAYTHRTKHLGIDIWLPKGTAVHSPWSAKVHSVGVSSAHKDYGTVVILEHKDEAITFYTLYGHLDKNTSSSLVIGREIAAFEEFARLGNNEENGHWVPHLHFQIILDLLGQVDNFDGVSRPDDWSFMSKICPDPALVFNEKFLDVKSPSIEDLLDLRNGVLGFGLSLSYNNPLHIVRGDGAYLIDIEGQRFLDTVNNVAHVGHENYTVVNAIQQQVRKLNTNTRYIHESVLKYANAIRELHPEGLEVVHFTNSGSEANELALRMAKTATGRDEILAIQIGYHGNTQGTINISSYKFDAEGGTGRPITTHLLDLPDTLRGKHASSNNAGKAYIDDAVKKIRSLSHDGVVLAAFIHESILSCGGQIVLPYGYLDAIYKEIRNLGGVVIADEVQVGFGRVGRKFWAYELQGVVPDIVVMGKPIGNGHPMGAVICTKEVAIAFNNGMEYFNTFGGNPVSSEAGLAVLKEIKDKKLQENACKLGDLLITNLKSLQEKYPIIADVRGHGLFLGIELIHKNGQPAAEFTAHIANEMRNRRILMSTDGPDHNVLKIKPPMVINEEDVSFFIDQLQEVFQYAFESSNKNDF